MKITSSRRGFLKRGALAGAAALVASDAGVAAQAQSAALPAASLAQFTKNGCFQCHGNEAQGGAAGPRLGPGAVSFARLSYVRKPAGDMPPYTTKVLADRDLADIYAFLESLPKPAPVSTIPLLAP